MSIVNKIIGGFGLSVKSAHNPSNDTRHQSVNKVQYLKSGNVYKTSSNDNYQQIQLVKR